METSIFSILLKFGQREHLEELRNGCLYMNSQYYFSKLELDPVRADSYEGAEQIYQPRDVKQIIIKNEKNGSVTVIKKNHLKGPIMMNLGKYPPCNIFSMYAINKIETNHIVDERNYKFGNSFVVFLNTQEIIDLFCYTAHKFHLHYELCPVEYYDTENHTGYVGPFRKPNIFSYQNEFRFIVRPGNNDPIRLNIGNIKAITSEIFPLSEINTLFKLQHVPDPLVDDSNL